MSKRKIWNVNEKKHYKMYKNGKQWFFAGMGIVAGLFGAGSTTIASADETPKGANLDLSKSKQLLATKTSATIPGSQSTTGSQTANSTHNSVTNSTSATKQVDQTSASQSASKAASLSLSESMKASKEASASLSESVKAAQADSIQKASAQKASEGHPASKTANAANSQKQPTKKTTTTSDQHSTTATTKSTTASFAHNPQNGSNSANSTTAKSTTSQVNDQNSQSLSASLSAAESTKQSQVAKEAKQSVSASQSMADSLSKSADKWSSNSTKDFPFGRIDSYHDESTGDSLAPSVKEYNDGEEALQIAEPKPIEGYVVDFSHSTILAAFTGFGVDGGNAFDDKPAFEKAVNDFARTAHSIEEINNFIKNSKWYAWYVTNRAQTKGILVNWGIDWAYKKQDDHLAIDADQEVSTPAGTPVDVHDVVNSVTNSDGEVFYPKKDASVPGLSWQLDNGGDIDWNKPGDYGVTITYFDSNSMEKITSHITVHITETSKASIKGQI